MGYNAVDICRQVSLYTWHAGFISSPCMLLLVSVVFMEGLRNTTKNLTQIVTSPELKLGAGTNWEEGCLTLFHLLVWESCIEYVFVETSSL